MALPRPRRERTTWDFEAGRLLKAARERARFSPEEAAARAGVSGDMVYRYERGESWPPYANLVRLAEAYGLAGPGDFFPNGGVSPETELMAPVVAAMNGLSVDQQMELTRHLASQVRMMRVFMAANVQQRSAAPVPDNVTAMPERTQPKWTPEFPVNPEEFSDHGDTDYPLELHAFEMEDIEAAAGGSGFDNGDMGTPLLSSKEVRDNKIRTVRVRGDSMAPTFEEGWKLAVDVTNQDAAKIAQDEAVLVYRKDEGMMLGRLRRVGKRVLLAKDNEAYQAIELQPGDKVVGTVSYIAWQPVPKGKKRSA